MGKRYKDEEPIDRITTTMGDLVRSQGLLGVLNNSRMPAVLGMQVRRRIKAVQAELEIYNETRKELLERYAKQGEDGKPLIIDNEYQIDDRAAFDAEFEKMLADEVILNVRPLQVADLDQIEIPRPAPADAPPNYQAWKPLPAELDLIAYLLADEP